MCSGGLRYPAFRLVKAGARLGLRDYTEDVPWRPTPFTATADVQRVLAEFAGGATIVLQGLHLHLPPVSAFCRQLEIELGQSVQANAYYTPRAAQGLPVHHDTHDVFVLQVAGEKRWLVYEPALELPLKDQRYGRELGAPGETVHDLVLGPGDTLYLPRGWLHEALTSESDSLHLTIGVNLATWIDAFRAAIDACADDVEFRRSVPLDGRMEADLLERLRERLAPEQVARRRRDRFVRTRRPIRHGQLGQLRSLADLSAETLVEQRPTVIADLDRNGERATLAFEGRTLEFPARVWEELAFAAAGDGPFCPADLPGELDGESRLVLVRRLVREGFLRVVPSSGADASA